ncbi:cation:proton antiporter regulatory subunit [Candidatus Omnitrophota bacterium]
MNLFLFMFVIVVSFIAVRIGAIAFQLTGLEWSLAKFQALSCFSGTGFTTREAEMITSHPQRRRIASVLMVLGNAGLVTLIATFANSLRPDDFIARFSPRFLHSVVPTRLVPFVNLLLITIAIYLFYRIFTSARIGNKITDFLRSSIVKRELVKRVTFEELIVSTGGYGVSQIEVCAESPVLNKSLRESNLRPNDITILAIEREQVMMPNPSANTQILLGDKLICFGKLENIRKELCLVPNEKTS